MTRSINQIELFSSLAQLDKDDLQRLGANYRRIDPFTFKLTTYMLSI